MNFLATIDLKFIWLYNLSSFSIPDDGCSRIVKCIKLDIYVFISKLPTHREMIILVRIFSVNQKSDTDELQESFRLLVYTCVIKCAVFLHY